MFKDLRWLRRVRTSKSNLSSKHDQRFSKFFFLLPQLLPLCLHTPPWDNKAYAFPTNIHRFTIHNLMGTLRSATFSIFLPVLWSCVIRMILEREEEIVVIAIVAQVAPDAEDRVRGEYLLVWRHDGLADSADLVTSLGMNTGNLRESARRGPVMYEASAVVLARRDEQD